MEMIHEAGQYVDTVKRVCDAVGGEVTFRGTVHRVRDMSDFSFVVMRVERGLIQCTFQGDAVGDIKRSDVRDAMVLEVTGAVREEPRAEHGVEVVLSAVKVLGKPYDQLPVPIGKKYMGLSLDVDLPLRPITLRHPRKQAIFRVQGAIADGFAQYMQSQGFTHIHTPKIVVAGAEGGANLFKLDYFGHPAYLAQSPQFHKQYLAGAFGRVYEIGSVYRAERHNTSRHLNEYMGLDFEMAYIDSMYDVMAMETGMLKSVMNYVKEHCPEELALLKADIPEIKEIPTIRFHEAKKIMEEKYGHKSKNRYDLNPDEEVLLCQWAKEEYGSEFVFVTHFRSGDHHRRPAYPRLSGADGQARSTQDERRAVRVLHHAAQVRHAAARRSGHRSRASDHAAARPEQHPRGIHVPARYEPFGAVKELSRNFVSPTICVLTSQNTSRPKVPIRKLSPS